MDVKIELLLQLIGQQAVEIIVLKQQIAAFEKVKPTGKASKEGTVVEFNAASS